MPAKGNQPTEPTPDEEDAPATQSVNRNFAIPIEQAEWLRLTAFMQRTSQAKLVREAIEDLRRKYDG